MTLDAKKGNQKGNNFLVKKDDNYLGYMHISNDYNGVRILSYIVKKICEVKAWVKLCSLVLVIIY